MEYHILRKLCVDVSLVGPIRLINITMLTLLYKKLWRILCNFWTILKTNCFLKPD